MEGKRVVCRVGVGAVNYSAVYPPFSSPVACEGEWVGVSKPSLCSDFARNRREAVELGEA